MFCQIFDPALIQLLKQKFNPLNEFYLINQTKYQNTSLECLSQEKYKYVEKSELSPSLRLNLDQKRNIVFEITFSFANFEYLIKFLI